MTDRRVLPKGEPKRKPLFFERESGNRFFRTKKRKVPSPHRLGDKKTLSESPIDIRNARRKTTEIAKNPKEEALFLSHPLLSKKDQKTLEKTPRSDRATRTQNDPFA
jgi:hypothetical protein